MAARRWVTSIDQSHLAATSSGMFLGLGFARGLYTIDEVIELLRSGLITGNIFIGVQIDGRGALGLKAYVGADETDGQSKPTPRRRSRRRHL